MAGRCMGENKVTRTGLELKRLRITKGIGFRSFCNKSVMGTDKILMNEKKDYPVSDIFEELYLYNLSKFEELERRRLKEKEFIIHVDVSNMPSEVVEYCVKNEIQTHYQNDVVYIDDDNVFAKWLREIGHEPNQFWESEDKDFHVIVGRLCENPRR